MSFLCLLSATVRQNSELHREIRSRRLYLPIFRWVFSVYWAQPCGKTPRCVRKSVHVVFKYLSRSVLWELGADHGLINHKDTKTKCRLYLCLSEFIDLRYSQSCWYFRPSYCPSNLLSSSPLPSFPKSTVYTGSVYWRGWMGCVELCWRPYSAGG